MKNLKVKITGICLILGAASVLFACKKKYDSPPVNKIPTGHILTIAQLKAMLTPSTPTVYFTDDYSVFGTVTMDESNGNLYKNVYIQDGTGAIDLHLLNSGGLYQGDSIRLNLKGTTLMPYSGTIQVDSVDVDKNVVILQTGVNVAPRVVNDLSLIDSSYQSYLVKLEGVEFASSALGQTYADAVNQVDESRTLEDCSGNNLIVRTSGYASFAGTTVAAGNGSLVGIVNDYNGTMQIYIRSMGEVNMTGTRCPGPYLSKNFDDGSVTSGGWQNVSVTGSIPWSIYSGGSDDVASISNYVGSANVACETWLISPAIDLSSSTSPVLNFDNACNYSGAALQVLVSTNYTGTGAPSSATWTNLSAQASWSTGTFTFVNSGNISLSSYKTANVYVAFKYTGSSTSGKTWELNNIKVNEN